ncbi:MAG: ABC transporter ATP-binding protein [Endomicrobium sp.]|jgi:lipoprotein-releasing system ATP-binding protein|nr:ABC transporter ATP-binding protein [Endomicrobium sp.]
MYLKVVNLTKQYQKKGDLSSINVLQTLNFEITSTEQKVALIGASGAGKSTLLHIMGLMEKPTSGKVYINGIDLFASSNKSLCNFRKNHIGFIFQFHYLIHDLTIMENILIPVWKIKNTKISFAKYLLHKIGLLYKSNFYPNELSGGEQQRVAIARALINTPKIIFADEPTCNLDYKTGLEIENLLFELADNITLVLITHNDKILYKFNKIIQIVNGKLI